MTMGTWEVDAYFGELWKACQVIPKDRFSLRRWLIQVDVEGTMRKWLWLGGHKQWFPSLPNSKMLSKLVVSHKMRREHNIFCFGSKEMRTFPSQEGGNAQGVARDFEGYLSRELNPLLIHDLSLNRGGISFDYGLDNLEIE